MPNLKDIQRRIASVKKTQQITRAMRMVAGAKLRRAQTAIEAARPYAERMRGTLGEIARSGTESEHPLLEVRDSVRKLEIVLVDGRLGARMQTKLVGYREFLSRQVCVGFHSTSRRRSQNRSVNCLLSRRNAPNLLSFRPLFSTTSY